MNSLLKSSALAVMVSLAMASTAGATRLDSNAPSAKSTESQILIGQATQRGLSRNDQESRRYIDEMIMLNMQMTDTAQKGMQSQDPEIRKVAQEMMKSSNDRILSLMEMRRRFFENPDKG